MRAVRLDVAYGLRVLRRRPLFALVAGLTLALGIGATTAIYTVIDGVLLRPLPFRSPGELVTVWQTDTRFRDQTTLRQRWNRLWFTYPEYQEWRAHQASFSDVAVYGAQEMALTGRGEPAEVTVYTATPSLLPMLGARPAFGQWFLPGEEGTGTERNAVLSHELWSTKFGADSAVIDRFITLDEVQYRVVGVMPRGFRVRELAGGGSSSAEVWIPIGSDGGGQRFDSSYEGIARLRPGVVLEVATLETDRLVRAAAGRAERGARLVPRLEAETSAARAPLVLLAVGAGLLLLTACANVATLLLGEAPARAHELATRFALGASAGRIIRQLLAETVALAALGAAGGVMLASLGVRAMLAIAPAQLPRLGDVTVNGRVLLFAIAAAAGTALFAGLAPAIAATRGDLATALRVGGRHSRRSRLQAIVVASQVAMAVLLLGGATLLTRSLLRLGAVDPGFRPEQVLTMPVTLPATRYESPASLDQFFRLLAERVGAVGGVASVSATSNLPFGGRNSTTSVDVEGMALPPGGQRPNVQRRVVRPGFFETLGLQLRSGRTFTEADRPGAADVIVIDEEAARRFWPTSSALGKRVRVFGAWFTVVGVVGSVRHGRLDEAGQPTVYLAHPRIATREMTVVMRLERDVAGIADVVRRATWSVDPTIPIPEIVPMSERIGQSMAQERYRTILVGTFGVSAVLLATIGIFGVAARSVNQRRKEIGIRVALGAQRGSIVRLVLQGQGASLGVGLAVGLVLARAAGPLLSRFLFGLSPSDPASLALTVGLVAMIAVVTTLVPARRAARIDPGRTLRDDRSR